MKVIILAGGRGTRLAEETSIRPKPMVEIGGEPILWHIMRIYAGHGYKDFLVACGYKGEMIKEYFDKFLMRHSDYFIDLRCGSREVVNSNSVDWRVGLIDTGMDHRAGGALLGLKKFCGGGGLLAQLGIWLGHYGCRPAGGFPPPARTAGHSHCGPPACALRRIGAGRRQGAGVYREAAD